VDFVSSTGFRGSYSFSCLLTLELDNFCFIQVDFVADGGFLLIIHIGFRKFWWISWISIFRPTDAALHTRGVCRLPHYGFKWASFCCDFEFSSLVLPLGRGKMVLKIKVEVRGPTEVTTDTADHN